MVALFMDLLVALTCGCLITILHHYNHFSHLLSSVCSKNIVHFIQSWFLTNYRIVTVVSYVPLRLSPSLTLREVGDRKFLLTGLQIN